MALEGIPQGFAREVKDAGVEEVELHGDAEERGGEVAEEDLVDDEGEEAGEDLQEDEKFCAGEGGGDKGWWGRGGGGRGHGCCGGEKGSSTPCRSCGRHHLTGMFDRTLETSVARKLDLGINVNRSPRLCLM